MSDIPEMSVQSTLTESTMQEEDISHSKTTVNALADVSNSTGSYSIPNISSRSQEGSTAQTNWSRKSGSVLGFHSAYSNVLMNI